jgi:integration host factor subunit alpha
MTKLEVATVLRQRTGLTQKQALELVDLFLSSVKVALLKGKKVSLVGFGTFSLKQKPARPGRNPRTGESIQIPSKSVVTFKPGREFRALVDGPGENHKNQADEQHILAAISADGLIRK